jgi:ABC-type Mn2+/Zn2+ transport system permease subunit
MSRTKEISLISVIIAAFSLLALGFSLSPIFEAPDEINHYLYGQYLATHFAHSAMAVFTLAYSTGFDVPGYRCYCFLLP